MNPIQFPLTGSLFFLPKRQGCWNLATHEVRLQRSMGSVESVPGVAFKIFLVSEPRFEVTKCATSFDFAVQLFLISCKL